MHGKEPLYFLKEVKPVVMKLDSNGPPFGKLSPPLYIVHFPRGLLWESITSKMPVCNLISRKEARIFKYFQQAP